MIKAASHAKLIDMINEFRESCPAEVVDLLQAVDPEELAERLIFVQVSADAKQPHPEVVMLVGEVYSNWEEFVGLIANTFYRRHGLN
jgi:hypothetical protein